MVDVSALISHRFRGFSKYENTIDGVNNALDFGVLNLEFDIRVSRCGTPMIYHDEFALGGSGQRQLISNTMASEFASLGGTFSRIPTAQCLFKAISDHRNKAARLLIDIKDAGFEEAIHALVCEYRLQNRVVYVSWVPNSLYALHEITPVTPLCLSHWCEDPNTLIRFSHKVHVAMDGIVPKLDHRYIHGERSGWYVRGGLRGDLREIIKNSGGSVCVPMDMVSRALVDDYHADGIKVSTFSFIDWPSIKEHKSRFNVDLYFIDNKAVFEDIKP